MGKEEVSIGESKSGSTGDGEAMLGKEEIVCDFKGAEEKDGIVHVGTRSGSSRIDGSGGVTPFFLADDDAERKTFGMGGAVMAGSVDYRGGATERGGSNMCPSFTSQAAFPKGGEGMIRGVPGGTAGEGR